MWTECFPCAGPQKNVSREVKVALRETIARRSPFRISYWEADVKVWLEVCFLRFRIGRLTSRCGWNSDFWRRVVARCRFHVCKCNPLRFPACRIALAVAPTPDAETCVRRHDSSSSVADVDSRDMDLRSHRCIWTLRHRCRDRGPETWILQRFLRHGSCRGFTVKDAEA